ncbi:hypothetical protein [Nitrospira sp. M1]
MRTYRTSLASEKIHKEKTGSDQTDRLKLACCGMKIKLNEDRADPISVNDWLGFDTCIVSV